MKKMKEKYGALYDAYVDINNNPKSDKIRQKIGEQYIVDSFTAMEGIKYRKNDKLRFMLVGWAPNGWGEKRLYGEVVSRDSFIYSSIMNLTNDEQVINSLSKGRFEWIADGDEWGHYPHNCYREGIDSLEDKEKIEKSPYHLKAQIWSYPKEVWCKLAQQIGHENSSAQNAWINRWYDNIVWSNLYKLYPVAGGNPNDLWKKIQFKACADLLLEEIRYFQPSHILFATDEEWFAPFNEYCFNNSIGGTKENKYIKHIGIYNNAKVVVTCRPDNRKAGFTKEGYTNATVEAFNSIN